MVRWMCNVKIKDRVPSKELRERLGLECGPMPNVMVALPNIGGALCSTPKSLADAHYYSGPKFTMLWGHVENILLLNKFFSDCRYVP